MSREQVAFSCVAAIIAVALLAWAWGLACLKQVIDAQARKTGCHDCLLQISDEGWADLWVPDLAWSAITGNSPEDGSGIQGLCPTCMIRRARRLGLRCRAIFTTGPFAATARAAAESMPDERFLSTFEARVFSGAPENKKTWDLPENIEVSLDHGVSEGGAARPRPPQGQ